MKTKHSNLRHISVYLGDHCNFDCTYCDRAYIKSIGGQGMPSTDVDKIVSFLKEFDDLELITLHGGEPFLYVKRMDEILTRLPQQDIKIGITTNGSLLKENEWFLEKWAKQIRLNISYDFIFQEENRDVVYIDEMIDLIRKYNIDHLYQYVLPIQDKRAFSIDNVQSIVRTMHKSGTSIINVIPLRHRRGKEKFEVLLDEINTSEFADMFMRFITVLYNYNIRVFVDGNKERIEKSYFDNHNKIILSPDGYLYPEYDFCEYKREEFRVGEWKNEFKIERQRNEDELVPERCQTCPSKINCGLKYLHKMFDSEPQGMNCVRFYMIIDALVDYTVELYKHKNMYEAIMNGSN